MMPAPPPGYILDPTDPTRAIPAPAPASRLMLTPPPKSPTPQTPEERAQTVASTANTQASTNKTNLEAANIVKPHVLTADEVAANPTLDPTKTWIMNGQGDITAKGNVPQPFKVGDSDAISHAWDILGNINQARTLSGKPLATGTLSATVAGIPIIGGLVGQNRANLQTDLGSIAGDLRQLGIRTLYEQTGKHGIVSIARNQAEQQALQSSLAPLGFVDQGGHIVASGPQPDAATLGRGLDQAQNIYIRHLARLYGMNPDDPASQKAITAGITDPALRATFLQRLQAQPPSGQPNDGGITQSNPLPQILGGAPMAVSSTGQAVINPQVQAIAPQLTQYLNADPKKVSNAMILGFVKKSGIDPSQWPQLQDALTNRGKTVFVVDPHSSETLSGADKTRAEASSSVPGAFAAGIGDTATLGAVPDLVGIAHAVTGAGPSRENFIMKRDLLASEHPVATFAGNAAGTLLDPLAQGGGLARTAGLGALYGFLGSDDPDLSSRLLNAGIGGATGAIAHGVGSAALGTTARGYRAAQNAILAPFVGDPEAMAARNALTKAANAMPTQDVDAATARLANLRQNGTTPPAAAALDRSGQDFLARLTSGSPSARVAADQAAASFRQAMPRQLAADFDQAIAAAAPKNDGHTAEFLNRPVRDIASDVQDMAGREFETGIAPIKNEKLTVTPELADDLGHERVAGAVRDALANHNLSDATRSELRGLSPQLKALADAEGQKVTVGGKQMTADEVRQAFPNDADAILQSAGVSKGPANVSLSVDGARNIATALDRTAGKLADGSEGAVELSRLSRDIRGAIIDQFPEYQPVNGRYASRMRAKEAMFEARRNFLGETPDQIDALSKASNRFTDAPNEPEYKGIQGAEPSGPVQPTNRQFALAGAREAATTAAGSGQGSATVARNLASGPNQQVRTAMVAGDDAASKIAAGAGAKADVADTIDRVTSGARGDQSQNWWRLGKTLIANKLTGGGAHYAAAHALAGMPGMTGDDAARVVRVYLDAGNADQALNSLSAAYGAKRARFIMARMAAVASAAGTVRNAPANSEPAQ